MTNFVPLLEFNSYPSLCEPSLDRHVNEPMLAEAFNIAGFHLTAKLKPKKKQEIAVRYGLDENGPIEFDPRLYDDNPGEGEGEGEGGEGGEEEQAGEVSSEWDGRDDQMVSEAMLGGREVRILIRAEEELSQSNGFARLIPQVRGLQG